MEKISNKSFVQRVLEKLKERKLQEVRVVDSYSAPIFSDEVQAKLNQKIREDLYIYG